MAEPNLSEILQAGASADPEKASGTPATVIDNSGLVKQLNENARFKAENDWRKYNTFLSNLKESYKDLGDISGMEIATQDRDALKQQTADIFKEIADNPRAFFGGQKLGEIQSKIAGLRSAATESKLNRVYDFAHREYMNRNPELNTPENQKTINDYWKQPLGKRNAYMLNMPSVFDYQEFAKGIMGSPSVMKKEFNVEFTPDKQFYSELEKTRYDKSAFMKQWDAGWNIQKDKYGHSIRGAIEDQFNKLPDQLKQQYGSPENYYKSIGEMAFNSDKDIETVTKGEFKANPQLYKQEELALKKEGVQQRWAMYGLAKRKLEDAEDEDILGADAAINSGLSEISKGRTITEDQGNGKVKEFVEIADPDLIKEYATIDKDGKTTNVGDVIRYDKDNDQFSLVYFKKKPYNSKLGTGGEIATTKSGKRIVEKTIPIDSRTFLTNKVKEMYPTKEKGKINSLIDDVLSKNKGGLWEILQKREGKEYKGGNEQKSYKYGNKTVTLDQVQKAAQQWNLSVDEYIKKFGLK